MKCLIISDYILLDPEEINLLGLFNSIWNTRKASQSEHFSDMFNKSIGLIVTWSELKLCQVA